MVRTQTSKKPQTKFKRTRRTKRPDMIGNDYSVGNPGGGRPEEYMPEYAEQAYKLCLLGASDAVLADFFEVSEMTINNWKKRYDDFYLSLREGKTQADANVAKSLYHRALGYSHPEDKIFNDSGTPLIVPTTKHYPPDTTAIQLWLLNRQPKLWKDRKSLEVSGEDGGPIKHEHEFTDETIKAAYNTLYRTDICGNGSGE